MPAQSSTQWLPPSSSYQAPQNLSGTSSDSVLGGGIVGDTLTALYGGKPGTANPISTARAATVGNYGNLDAIRDLTLGTNAISAEGARLPFEMNLPNYEEMFSTASGNALNELRGQLPSDVQNLIAQQAAERGVGTGMGSVGPNSTAAYLKALGLTSLDTSRAGLGELQRLMAMTPTGESFDPSRMFVKPGAMQAAQQAANEMAAAPDPGLSGMLDTFMP